MDPYGSHAPVLKALAATVRLERVLELGGGKYSTPTFLGFPDLTMLVTVEANAEWAKTVVSGDPRHTVIDVLSGPLDFDLILVDDGDCMDERLVTLRSVSAARPSGLVVVHDFEHEQYRGATQFDHVAISDSRTPWTAVAWNEDSPHGGEWLHRVVAEA